MLYLELRSARIPQLLGLDEGGFGFCGATERLESPAFIVPGICILRIDLDSLIKSLNSLIVPVLIIKGYAFIIPGFCILRIDLDSLVVILNRLIVLALSIKSIA